MSREKEMSNERTHKDKKVTQYTHLGIYLSGLQTQWSHLDPKSVKKGTYVGREVENRWR
jgi:hypothetical protein